jgi:hypothetical protein
MKKRLLTVKELNKLVQLGYMTYNNSFRNTYAYITDKAAEEFPIINRGGFRVDKLKELKNKKFEYLKSPHKSYRLTMNNFTIVNYKFYCFWRKILSGEKEINFEEIEL